MKIKILSLILMIFIGISASAQTTPTAVIIGNAVGVIGPGGTIYPVSLQIQLTGCGPQVPTVPGGSVVTNFYKQAAPGPSYSATITAYGNDVITCGTQSYTTYAATWLINNQPAAPTATYRLVQGQTCNISDGSCKPIGFVPPVIARGAGLFCATGQQLLGFNADYTPSCQAFTSSALPTFRTNSITNSDQTVLNLITTGGISATASGGNITLNGAGLVSKNPSATQTITQPINTDLNVITSGTGKWYYNGSEVLTVLSSSNFFIIKNSTSTQSVNQTGGSFFQYNGSEVLTRSFGIAQTPTSDQTVIQPGTTTLSVNSLNGILNATLFAGADLGAKVTSAVAALGGKCGIISIPTGTYTWSSDSVLMRPCQTLQGNGAVINVTISNGKPALVFAVLPDYNNPTNTFFYTQGGLKDITFIGPGPGTVGFPTNSIALWIGGDLANGIITPTNYIATLMRITGVHIRNFGCGVKYAQAFQISWIGGVIENNYDNICFQDNNTGLENLNFHGTQILNAIHMGINQPYVDLIANINLYGTSIDYNGQDDPNGALINFANGTLNVFGGHFENRQVPFIRLGATTGTVQAGINGAVFNMVATGTFPAYINVSGTNNFINIGSGNLFAGSGATVITNLFNWTALGANNQTFIEPYRYLIGPNSSRLIPIGGTTFPQFYHYPVYDAAGDTVSTVYSNTISPNSLLVNTSITNGAGMQKFRSAGGCSTGAAVGATCTTSPMTWSVAMPDTNYTISCTLDTPTGIPTISSINRISGAQFSVTIAALTAAVAGGNLNCIAMHD